MRCSLTQRASSYSEILSGPATSCQRTTGMLCRLRKAMLENMATNGSGDVEAGRTHDPKTGTFSFWSPESAAVPPQSAAAPNDPFLKDWRRAAQISAANEAKLR